MKWLGLVVVLAACSTDTFVGPDGSTVEGGAGDARDDGTVGADGGCASGGSCPPNALCNDFDDGQQSLAPFVNISQSGGNVTFSPDLHVTCPSAVVAFAPGFNGSTGTPPRGALGVTAPLTVPNAVAHARIELDAILPKSPTGSATFLFIYPNADTDHALGLVWAGGNWFVHDAVTNDDLPITPRTDTWNHLALDVTFSASGGAGSVVFEYVDAGGQPQTAKLQKSTLAATIVSSISFAAGVAPIGPTSGSMVMHIDDLVFSPF